MVNGYMKGKQDGEREIWSNFNGLPLYLEGWNLGQHLS